jgi:dienelactone hydrolase
LLVVAATGWAPRAAAQTPVDPAAEARNVAVGNERRAAWATPSMLAGVAGAAVAYQEERERVRQSDPERSPDVNTCTVAVCPVDPRLAGWEQRGRVVEPVLFTARSGATLSGHVWATAAGLAKRPGVLVINGSVVGYEEGYWFLAQSLASSGYVVMTFDVQGEGMSDQLGEAPDEREGAFAGTPLLGLLAAEPGVGGSGLPFYDGGEDALDFFASTPDRPYEPVPSRTSGTSHAAKQRRRVAAGLNPAYNPLWRIVDRSALGVTGHSYGAVAASWLVQQDPRLKAAVALDSLCLPVWPSPDELESLAGYPGNQAAGVAPAGAPYAFSPECFGAPAGPAPPLRKPALGLTADYLLPYAPYVTYPDPMAKSPASLAYTKAGVDSGQIVIRGGTHFEFNDDPTGVVPASLRGIDLATWYTLAWFDKYLERDPTADARLLSSRWRDDRAGGAADPSGDANLFSSYYRSRLAVTLAGGKRVACGDLRAGCPGQPAAAADCGPRDFSFLALAVERRAATACAPCATRASVRSATFDGETRRLDVRGSARVTCPPGATLASPALRRVDVAIARTSAGRCSFVTGSGRLSRPRRCDALVTTRARGTGAWRLRRTAKLPPGRYAVSVLATDQDGRRGPSSRRPTASFRVR